MNIYDRVAVFNKKGRRAHGFSGIYPITVLDGVHAGRRTPFLAWCNYARKHEALKDGTRAMASKLRDHVWTIKELIERAAS